MSDSHLGQVSWCKGRTDLSKYPGVTPFDRRLRRTYSITEKDYDILLNRQNSVCAIWNNPETRLNKFGKIIRLTVDHDHTTGQIRGLLCSRCNKALGVFNDNILYLYSAIKYLKVKL